MEEQKAVIELVVKQNAQLTGSCSHKQREEESVASLVQMSGVEAIGMARTAVILPHRGAHEARGALSGMPSTVAADFATGGSRMRRARIQCGEGSRSPDP